MKKIQLLVVSGLILAVCSIARADSVKPASITIVGVQGQARYSTDGKQWHPLVGGKILGSGAVIETAANSSVDLVVSGTPIPVTPAPAVSQISPAFSMSPDPNVRGFSTAKPRAEQNVIRMGASTMLAVDKLTVINTSADSVSDTELDLRAGNVFTSVKKMSASSQYIIKLPDGVAGIRGSSGSLGADGSAQWLTGTLVVSHVGADGAPHVTDVPAGYGLNANGQVEPLSPQVLAALRTIATGIETLLAQITVIDHDITMCYISPTQGQGGNNQGGNQGGGGGG